MALMLTKLREGNDARMKLWDPDNQFDVRDKLIELGGECGEALNQYKKHRRHELGMKGGIDNGIEMLTEELADVVICADLVAAKLGIDLDKAVIDKFNATSKKNGFHVRLEPDTSEQTIAALRTDIAARQAELERLTIELSKRESMLKAVADTAAAAAESLVDVARRIVPPAPLTSPTPEPTTSKETVVTPVAATA